MLAIVFVATVVRSAFGFGEALVAVPLLALFIPLQVATPLAVMLSITVAAAIVIQDWRQIHLRSAAGLVVATLFGLPVGLLILTHAHRELARASLGILIALFAAFSLAAPERFRIEREHRGLLLSVGFVAGILGGAYGMNGPPLAVYGSLCRWPPQRFRATLQAYFLPASTLALIGFWSAGLWTRTVTLDYLWSIPVLIPAVLLGRSLNRRFSGPVFLRAVYVGLIAIGGILFAEAISRHA